MRHSHFRLLGGAALALLLSSCRPPSAASDLGVKLSAAPDPLQVGRADLTLRLSENGQPLNGAKVSVEGNMTHPGMAPVRADAASLGKGVYRVPDFDFNMAGDWVLTVEANRGGKVRSTDVPVTVRGQ